LPSLAAVDMHTSDHLVKKCITGRFAAGRTIILVTHHLSLCLPIASHFVELSDGRIVRQGPAQTFVDEGLIQNVTNLNGKDDTKEEAIENEADMLGNGIKPAAKLGDGKLVEKEARPEGHISWRAYYTYIRSAGIICFILCFAFMLLLRGINIVNQVTRNSINRAISSLTSQQVYLAKWGEAYERASPTILQYVSYPWDNFPSPDQNVRPWIMLYLYLSLAGASMIVLETSLGLYASLQASRTIFNSLLYRLSRAPIRFFDVTPIGRILNRFTTDMNTIDANLWNSAKMCLYGVLNFLASLTVILSLVPPFTPFALFIAWLYIRLAPPYIRASRDLRRLELTSLSPAFAGFDELLRGITHVRAFGMEQRYQDRFYAKVIVCLDSINTGCTDALTTHPRLTSSSPLIMFT